MNKLFEMADFFVGFNVDKKYKPGKNTGRNILTQNGGKDRVRPPHFHVYDSQDKSFSLEVDLQRLLCLDIVYFLMYKQGQKKTTLSFNDQEKFNSQAKNIYKIMQLKPNVKQPAYLNGCCNNVEAAIRIFNKDADLVVNAGINVPDDEKLLAILAEKSDTMKICEKYNPCFAHISKDIRDKYKECFQKPF